MTEKLLPCPFCGGEARIMLEEDDMPDDSFHNVYCKSCGVQFWVKSKTEAITLWNRRTPVVDCDALKAENATIKERISDLEKLFVTLPWEGLTKQ